ncbi:MAG: AmmeMemoRadiSam system protein B [Deltaproteobacteria bacterium]|nr:AmmeMemoRadiSam system protein B [Candidatus Anaeroferrophillacea bacterium]
MVRSGVRRPAVAGTFYPADPETLRREVDRLLGGAGSVPVSGEIIALISPHAGYVYSGGVAAEAYRQVAGGYYDLVVVVSPSHHAWFQGVSVYREGDYLTPLGIVPVDRELVDDLDGVEGITWVPQAHLQEHALEVQLPFLQVVLGEFRLLPLVMGSQDWQTARRLADILAPRIAGRRVLLVASSDLSHFHRYDQAVELDRHIVDAVAGNDPRELWRVVSGGEAEACGAGPMIAVLLLAAALGATDTKVLAYRNSGDVSGERRQVVGYMAAVCYRRREAKEGGA